jgi:hypothetical protein
MQIARGATALVLTGPRNDFLSPDGATWELVGRNVQENGTVEHIEQLLVPADSSGTPGSTARTSTSRTTTSGSSAAPWSRRCTRSGVRPSRPARDTGPHRVRRLAPAVHAFPRGRPDGRVQPAQGLRGRSGMIWCSNWASAASTRSCWPACPRTCAESHLQELLEQGFEVAVVFDATAAAQPPELGDGYAASFTNFRYSATSPVPSWPRSRTVQAQRRAVGCWP